MKFSQRKDRVERKPVEILFLCKTRNISKTKIRRIRRIFRFLELESRIPAGSRAVDSRRYIK